MPSRVQKAIFRLSILCLAALLLPLAGGTRGAGSSKGLDASTTQRVHPVLIRNDHNALLQVVVEVKHKQDVRVRSVGFSLDGTDNLSDLESLEPFYTGEKREFAPETAFGKPVQPAARISFHGDQILRAGTHVFWLSCRLRSKAGLSRKVDAACTSIDTTAGKLTPRDQSPGCAQADRHRAAQAQ